MEFVVVPNELRDSIYKAVDEKLQKSPEAKKDREIFYARLLMFYHAYGYIPKDFELVEDAPKKGTE